MTNCGPIVDIVLDEIALEGLDGITIESLWLRLSVRLNFAYPLNSNFRMEIWNFLRKNASISFYELPEPRPLIRIFNRGDYVESDADQNECPFTIYKFNPITGEDGLMGSCQDYTTRIPIDHQSIEALSLKAINDRFNNRFIIVANQQLREKSILPDYLTRLTDVTPFLYSIVERIGRSRYNGEKSNGRYSLSELFESGKMHYIRKCLLKHKLIMRQPYYEKQGEHATPGFLLHLPRFFTEFKTKQMLLTEQIVNILKNQPNCIAEYAKIKDSFDLNLYDSLRKLYKLPLFQKFVQTDVRVPYRAIYPNASEKEYKKKKVDEERILRVLQLRDPNVDVNDLWPHDVENDDDDEGQTFLDVSKQLMDVPLLKQCLDTIKATRSTGIGMVEVGKQLGLSKLNARSVIRNLERLKQITSYTVDEGRQRVSKYISVRHKELNKRRLETAVAEINSDVNVTAEEPPPVHTSEVEIETVKYEPELIMNVGQMASTQEMSLSDQMLDSSQIEASTAILCNVQQITVPSIVRNSKPMSKSNFTIRIAKRLAFILRTVSEETVIKDVYTLKKKVLEEEKKLGYKDEMCKKSLYRLLTRLSIDKRIKLFNVSMQLDNNHKVVMVITDPSVEPSNCPKFTTIIEIAKAKFMVGIANIETKKSQIRKQEEKRQRMSDVSWPETTSTDEPIDKKVYKKVDKKVDENIVRRRTNDPEAGLKYGYTPKFIRMRTLHEFLYYLIYEQRQDSDPIDPNLAIHHWKQLEPLLCFNQCLPQIWSLEMGWKIFVPPLVPYSELASGWALMTDVIHRLPLSLFVRVMNISVEVAGLNELLDDPIKKHYLLKNIPTDIQCELMSNKKHIYMIDETMRRLCCIGLLQIGTQWQKEKEQVFIYLNLRANILDTTKSRPGYAHISEEEYLRYDYNFTSFDEVTRYWHDLSRVCLQTPLGRRIRDSERGEPIQKWQFRPDLLKHMECKLKEDIMNSDHGETPGDRFGAGGLDSSFYAHLLRNWSFANKTTKKALIKVGRFRAERKGDFQIKPITLKRASRRREITAKVSHSEKPHRSVIPVKRIIRSATVKRKIVNTKRIRKTAYSDIDRIALSEMTKLRVTWTAEEDNMILFCKVAMMYLCPNNRKQMVSTSSIRDILHWHLKSTNKTSKACQRRLLYMMKNTTTASSVHTCLQDIQHNPEITKKFNVDLYDKLKERFPIEDDFGRAMKIVFVDFVYLLLNHFVSLNASTIESRETILPNTIGAFKRIFVEKTEPYKKYRLKYMKPKTKHNINVNTLYTLIHCSVCCAKDKASWSIHLYDIYKDYPETELSEAMTKIRNDHLISVNKTINSKMAKGVVPLSSNKYHLSVTYQNQLSMTISYEIFSEMYELFSELRSIAPTTNMHLTSITAGRCFSLSQFIVSQMAGITIELPRQILVMDKKMKADDENLLERNRKHFRELFEIVPSLAIDSTTVVQTAESATAPTPEKKKKKKVAINAKEKTIEYHVSATERIMKLDDSFYHFFCLLKNLGATIQLNKLNLSPDKFCPFDCILSKPEPIINIIDLIKANEIILRRLNPENHNYENLPDTCTIQEDNIILIFSVLVSRIFSSDGESFELDDISDHGVLEIALDVLDDDVDNDYGVEDNMSWFNRQPIKISDPDDMYEDFDVTTDQIKKSYSFLSTDITPEKIHNFFYVNSCKILLDYPANKSDQVNNSNHSQLMRLDESKKEELLQKIVSVALWRKKPTADNEDIPYPLRDEFSSPFDYERGRNIYKFIKSKRELGAENSTLLNEFHEKEFIIKVLRILCKHQLVLRAGILDFCYIHWHFVTPWLVSTYHLKRLTKESLPPNKFKLMDITATGKRKRSESETHEDEQPMKAQREGETDSVHCEASTSSGRLPKRLDKITIQAGDVEKILNEPRDKFFLLINPWIRVNGSLNRRVLDKWMGCVLLHCMANPSITGLGLCHRFSLLQPANIRLLLEYLEFIESVTIYVDKSSPVSLWSTYKPPMKELATELDSIEDIFVDVAVDAASKMAAFIGEKKYFMDFI